MLIFCSRNHSQVFNSVVIPNPVDVVNLHAFGDGAMVHFVDDSMLKNPLAVHLYSTIAIFFKATSPVPNFGPSPRSDGPIQAAVFIGEEFVKRGGYRQSRRLY